VDGVGETMKLVNFYGSEGVQAGLVRDGGIEDLSASNLWQGPAPVTLSDISALAGKLRAPASRLVPIKSLRLAPVVVTPEKIICVGLNYRRHAIEANMPIPTTPVIFGKFANSLSASGERIALPTVDVEYDYEAELGVVIGREARDVSIDRALDFVAGYCCANDLSARSAQLATSQWMIGKMLDGFLPLGPYLVTTDDIPDPQALRVLCQVNGEVRQLSWTSDMIFSVAEIVAFLSRYATLKPGDVIITGTPEGVQMGQKTPVWLKPGDEVAVDITGLGVLTNTLTTEEARS
jgi:2-keto-4-pentenoate hydratase/2-oxohepta-3-ene-1,7-dioic acid hydratase in catechol pathway